MELYKVLLPNEYFPVGAFVEVNDGDAQQVLVESGKGRLHHRGYCGFVFPIHLCKKYMIKLQVSGVDQDNALSEMRNAYKEEASPRNEFWDRICEDEGEEPRQGDQGGDSYS